MKKITAYIMAFALLLTAGDYLQAQDRGYMPYIIEGSDTLFVDTLSPSYAYTGRKKGRQWRQYYRMVHNFGKVYPYALQARDLVIEADSTIATDNLKRRSKEKYINSIQSQIFDNYESVVLKLTISQGKLLVLLIGRETGLTPYEIIKGYKSGITAGFWQGVAKVFGGSLKKEYDPEEDDRAVEDIIKIWERGEYPALYYSIFGKEPEIAQVKFIDPSSKKR